MPKKEIKMIDSYDRLPVGRYAALLAVDEADDLRRSLAVVSILTGEDEDTLLALPVPDYAALSRRTSFLLVPPVAASRVDAFRTSDGTVLRVQDSPTRMTAAQYIDFQTFAADADGHMAELLACICIPQGCAYMDGYDVERVKAVIRDEMPVTVALGLVQSFLARLGRSLRASLTYSAWQLRRRAKKEKDVTRQARMEETARVLTEAVRSFRRGDGSLAWTLLASASETAGITSIR